MAQQQQVIRKQYQVYRIGDRSNNYAIELTQSRNPYNADHSERKAHSEQAALPDVPEIFVDRSFQIDLNFNDVDSKGTPLKLRRLYQLYDQDLALFDEQWSTETFLKSQPSYPSFLGEFIMLDKEYVKTLFFTKQLTKRGYYQYFVRRNGEYYVDYVDDWIPVEGHEQLPIWGLSINEPWKIILMKAWIKEKGSLEAVIDSQPFEFIEAFGLPGYRALSIKKQIEALKISTLKEATKQAKVDKIPFHDDTYIVVGKTRSNRKVRELGLVPNMAGYKISTVHKENPLMSSIRPNSSNLIEQSMFRVRSLLPSSWTGKYSVLSHNFGARQKEISPFNIEHEFIATYEEVSEIFSKFYAVRRYNPDKTTSSNFLSYANNEIEDSIFCYVNNKNPHYFFQLNVEKEGLFNVNVQLPFSSERVFTEGSVVKKRCPHIKLIICRRKQKESKQPVDSYEFYDGQYVKGYHKNLNRFVKLLQGNYYIFVKIDNSQQKTDSFSININANAVISRFREAKELTEKEQSNILQATLYNYAKKYGVKAYTEQVVKDRRVYLCNGFDEIGFGIVAVNVDPHSKFFIGMRVNRDLLVREIKIDFCQVVHGLVEKSELLLVDKGGDAQVVVLQKSDRTGYANHTFPPPCTFDFYEIYDNV